ncbi:MAG: M1 family metallopeptidase [Candidatus Marinimicrobia bacterium]|nr:M1 family metallopeptidase [Candidatus Neomarinimicrobiota bacterium]
MKLSGQHLRHLILLICLLPSISLAEYWQQYVEYDMNAVLDADTKTLTTTSNLLYVNHSPDTLNQILMHLYHNAYNAGTIAAEVWSQYSTSIGDEQKWSGINVEDITSDSSQLDFSIRDDTILEIQLKQSLSPGDTLHFHMNWTLIIHAYLDRSGYQGSQFDFAQWYPKFVVYDENGWHDDPFGDWGEFYGEFGTFRVNLDVPYEQIVCATGVVVDGDPGWSDVEVDTAQQWEAWLEEFSSARKEQLLQTDSLARRTVSFLAENVHDFAWMCSRDFVYEHGNWSGVDIHVLFNTGVGENWTKAVVKHGISAIRWLSEKFGPYPYPQFTITHALLGGGMEYPMLIMDETHSEGLIVHEAGHNWFYGLFGNDELDDAWLDEGLTSFQTLWYQEIFYPENGYALTRNYITEFESEHLPRVMYQEKDYKPIIKYIKSPLNEPVATHAYDFQNTGSYRSNVYDRAAMMIYSLKSYLGEDRFLAGMQLYYQRWALKHVNEERFVKSMEDGSGEELDWFFDQWLHTTKYVDYELCAFDFEHLSNGKYRSVIDVKNNGGLFVPIVATVYGENGETQSAPLEEFRFRTDGTIQIESDFRPTDAALDADNVFLDVDRRNNRSWLDNSWRYNFKDWENFPGDKNLILWKPHFGYNDDAGLGLGVRLDRVYRYPGDYVALEVDHNFLSGNPDVSLSFKKEQIGLPFQAILSGTLGSWRSMSTAVIAYEMSWAKRFWRNPVHYLTLEADYTNSDHALIPATEQSSFTRLGLRYELQNNLFGGTYGFSASVKFSPRGLGNFIQDFSQESLMSYWTKSLGSIQVSNRSNFLSNSSMTPGLVMARVASADSRTLYLDRLASSLHHTDRIDLIGSRYHLMGGGRMRGYSDSLDAQINYLWSNNLDLSISPNPVGAMGFTFITFFDLGQTSADGAHWTWISDLGFGVKYRPHWKRTSWITTLLRPLTLHLQFPVARLENETWKSLPGKNLWTFSISN